MKCSFPFQWCKNYKNRPRDARVIVENQWFLFHGTQCIPDHLVAANTKLQLGRSITSRQQWWIQTFRSGGHEGRAPKKKSLMTVALTHDIGSNDLQHGVLTLATNSWKSDLRLMDFCIRRQCKKGALQLKWFISIVNRLYISHRRLLQKPISLKSHLISWLNSVVDLFWLFHQLLKDYDVMTWASCDLLVLIFDLALHGEFELCTLSFLSRSVTDRPQFSSVTKLNESTGIRSWLCINEQIDPVGSATWVGWACGLLTCGCCWWMNAQRSMKTTTTMLLTV